MTQTTDLLSDLIAYPTISADPNMGLVSYCADYFRDLGAQVTVIKDATGKKANLYAEIGPTDRAGVLLSGHPDVVPVAVQGWTVPPFEMTQWDGRLFGRGTTYMKGFVACALYAAARAAKMDLQTPLRLAQLQGRFPTADISVEVSNSYPPLGTAADSDVGQLVQRLSGCAATIKVAFGIEGGLFSSRLDVPTVVCGPGSMAQGHKPDEFIEMSQLAACDAMLDALLARLGAGL